MHFLKLLILSTGPLGSVHLFLILFLILLQIGHFLWIYFQFHWFFDLLFHVFFRFKMSVLKYILCLWWDCPYFVICEIIFLYIIEHNYNNCFLFHNLNIYIILKLASVGIGHIFLDFHILRNTLAHMKKIATFQFFRKLFNSLSFKNTCL